MLQFLLLNRLQGGALSMHMIRISVFSCLLLPAFTVDAAERWFNRDIVDYGAQVFQQNCAVCHGSNAEGTRDWRKTDANGNYPPPPLDGSAHAWHHSLGRLARSIKQGGMTWSSFLIHPS